MATKLSPAMQLLIEALETRGYVDPMRDLGRHTTSGTIVALMNRGILREADRAGRHYPATSPHDVHGEALEMNIAWNDTHSSAYWERATEGLPREAAFTGPTEPAFAVDDLVRHPKGDETWRVSSIQEGDRPILSLVDPKDPGHRCALFADVAVKVEPTTPTIESRVRAALLSPDLDLVRGVGSAREPGEGEACTISEINLVLTGKLNDGPHPCMSEVIRRWVIRVQDDMPDAMRNGKAWREAAVGIAGSAATPDVEQRRAALLLDWMWQRLGDPAVLAAIPETARPAWDRMLTERSYAASRAANAAASAAIAANAAYAAASAAYAASASDNAADASDTSDTSDAYAAASAAYAADAANAAAYAAVHAARVAASTAYAYDNDFWKRANPVAVLVELINLGSQS